MFVLPNPDTTRKTPRQVRQWDYYCTWATQHARAVPVLHDFTTTSTINTMYTIKMTPADPDWVRFRDHETSIRRRHYLNTPLATLHRSLAREWKVLLDQAAYARCLAGVADQHEDAEEDFAEAQRIDSRHMLVPHQEWQRAELVVIDEALESRNAHIDALLRLLAEQKRLRANGVINASKRSRDWTRAELEASRGRLRQLLRMQDEAQRSQDAAQRSAPAVQSGSGPAAGLAPVVQGGAGPVAIPAPAVHGAAGPVAGQDNEVGDEEQAAQEGSGEPEEQEGDLEQGEHGAEEEIGAYEAHEEQEGNEVHDGSGEQGGNEAQRGNEEQEVNGHGHQEHDQAGDRLDELQTPVALDQAADESSRQSTKRSRDQDDDASDRYEPSPRKSPRHSVENQEPEILIEPQSSEGIPLAEPQDLAPEADPRQAFDSTWQEFLSGIADKDREQWDTLYEQAQILADWNMHKIPDSSSDEALEKLQAELNDGLRQVLNWSWEEYVDKVKANSNGAYHEDDWQQAQLAWDGALWRFDQGRSPMWPPPLKTAARHDPAPEAFPEHGVRPLTDSLTALEVAKDLGFGDITGLDGQWSYLTTVGGGNHGEAGLWLNVRYDEHHTLVEVSR